MNRKSLIQFAHLSKQFTYFIRLDARALCGNAVPFQSCFLIGLIKTSSNDRTNYLIGRLFLGPFTKLPVALYF